MKKKCILLIIILLLFSFSVVNAKQYAVSEEYAVDGEIEALPDFSYLFGTYLFTNTSSMTNQNFILASKTSHGDNMYQVLFGNFSPTYPTLPSFSETFGSDTHYVCISHINGVELDDSYCPTSIPDKFVTFYSSNDSGEVSQRIFFVEGSIITPPPAETRKGYDFACWTLDDGSNVDSRECYDFSFPVIDGSSFDAKYDVIKYTINYDLNGGSGTAPSSTVCDAPTSNLSGDLISSPCNFAENTGTMNGYTFAGWSFVQSDTTDGSYYNPGDDLFDYLGKDTVVNLYAVWVPNEYTITYILNNNETNIVDKYTYSSDGVTVNLFTPSKDGFIFTEWTSSEGGNVNGNVLTISQPKNISLTANYDYKTIKFVYNDGNTISQVGLCSYQNNSCSLDDMDSATGWIFRGWKILNTDVVISTEFDPHIFDKDTINVEPVFDKIEYTANIVLNGGVGGNYTTKYNIVDSSPLTLGLNNYPVKEGYTFVKWQYPDGTEVNINNINRVEDLTIYAVFNPNTITIKYYDGNTDLNIDQICSYDSACYVSAEDLIGDETKEFNGFMYNGIIYHYGDEITNIINNGTIKFVANYTYIDKVYYEIDYDFDDRDGNAYLQEGSLSSIESTEQNISIPNAYSKGYNFVKWQIKQSDNTYVDSNGTISGTDALGEGNNKKIYLKAVWEPVEFNIIFHGERVPENTEIVCTYDVSCSLGDHSNLAEEGYKLLGWSLINTGSVFFGDNLDVTNLYDEDTTINLYAVWELDEYNIYYYANGGEMPDSYPTVYYPNTESISLPIPTKIGNRFVKWVDLDGNEVNESNILSKKSNVILAAIWTDEYTISYRNTENDEYEILPTICYYGITCDLGNLYTDRENYRFTGYVNEENEPIDGYLIVNDNSVSEYKITGTWSNEFNVYFRYHDTDASYELLKTCIYGVECDLSNHPVLENYRFMAYSRGLWNETFEDSFTLTDTTEENVYLTGIWENNYSVLFRNTSSDEYEEIISCLYGVTCYIDSIPIRDGYRLIGFLGEDPAEPVDTPLLITDTTISEIRLTGVWTNEYTVMYRATAIDEYEELTTCYYDVECDLTLSVPERIGYRLTGFVDEIGTPVSSILSMEDTSIDAIYITGAWTNEYNVMFQPLYMVGDNTFVKTCQYGVTCDISEFNPTYSGNRFLGYVDSDNNPVATSFVINNTSIDSYQLYGSWTDGFNVMFKPLYSVGENTLIKSCTYGETCDISEFTPSLSGNRFLGYVDFNNNPVTTSFIFNDTNAEVYQLYGSWTDGYEVRISYGLDHSEIFNCTYDEDCDLTESNPHNNGDYIVTGYSSSVPSISYANPLMVSDVSISIITFTAIYNRNYHVNLILENWDNPIYLDIYDCTTNVACNIDLSGEPESGFNGDFDKWVGLSGIDYPSNGYLTLTNDQIPESGNIDFIADWTGTYVIRVKNFENSDESYIFNTCLYGVDCDISGIEIPTVENYQFLGWRHNGTGNYLGNVINYSDSTEEYLIVGDWESTD